MASFHVGLQIKIRGEHPGTWHYGTIVERQDVKWSGEKAWAVRFPGVIIQITESRMVICDGSKS